MLCLVTQLCPTLCDPIGCSPPGSSVHGDSLAKNTEWVAMLSPRESSWPGIKPVSPTLQVDSLLSSFPSISRQISPVQRHEDTCFCSKCLYYQISMFLITLNTAHFSCSLVLEFNISYRLESDKTERLNWTDCILSEVVLMFTIFKSQFHSAKKGVFMRQKMFFH